MPMKSETDFIALPPFLLDARDQLRVVGYELVHYTNEHAREEANRYQHPPADYEYAIHKIEFVEQNDGQIYISEHAFYCSEKRIPDWTKYYTEKEKPEGLSLLKAIVNPVGAIVSILAPPFMLTALGMAGIGQYMKKRDQDTRRNELSALSDMPKFWRRYGA